MNKDNASKTWKLIQETGDFLKGKLPDHPNHPKGRNPYAHVALDVKKGDKILFGKYSGQSVKVDDIEYLVMREEDIMGIVE